MQELAGPVLLNHAQGYDPPLLGGLQPDLPLDHLVPGPANFPAAVERICVRTLLADKSRIHNLFCEFLRQHHNMELGFSHL